MKFLLDAQLPKKLSLFLSYKGHDSLYTLELPNQNRSLEENRFVEVTFENIIVHG